MMPEFKLYLLGNFHLIYQGETVLIAQARLQSLLAYLTFHRNAPLSRQHLAFIFWADSSEAQAHTNLRQLLHLLRSAWPAVGEFLHIDAKTLSWKPEAFFRCDVTEFEQTLARATEALHAARSDVARAALEDAVALYSGDLLPSCYEDWLLSERERLRQRLIEGLEQLVALCESLRDYPSAIHYAQRLLRTDPLHETTYRRLMRLHALNGDRASALRTYHVCATILGRELGVEPNQDTQAAHARLLQLETPPAPSAVAPLRPAPSRDRPLRLVGRQPAWEMLQAAWQLALKGSAPFVCIVGEAGIGKTRLVEELIEWTRQQGIRHAYARAYAARGSLAYAPVIEWLRADVFQAVWQQLPDLWLSEVARLRPELLIERPALPHPEPLTESWQRQRFFEALAHTILAAGQPLLLVMDDLQWCDQETLEWLHYLLHFDAQARLLVVGALRPEEVGERHPLTPLLFEMRSRGRLTEIELGPLMAAESAVLARQVAAHELDSETVHELYQITEGNPLFLVEMVRAQRAFAPALGEWQAAQEGAATPPRALHLPLLPSKVQAVIGRRLAQLSPAARELASLAAVMGRWFIVPVLAQASNLTDDALVAGIDELWQRRLIREQGADAYDFSHDYIREMAYTTTSPARRRMLHRRVARALETVYGNSLETIAGQLALHYEQAGMAEQAIACYRRAVTAANQLGAYAEVVTHLNKALTLLTALPTTPERIEQKVDALLLLGDALILVKGFTASEVETVYRQARELCLHIEQDEKRFRALRGLRTYWGQRGRWALASELTEEMRSLAEVMQTPIYIQEALLSMGSVCFHQGHFQEAYDCFALALSTSPQPTTDPLVDDHDSRLSTLFRLSTTLWFLGYPVQALARQGEMLTLASTLRRPFDQIIAIDFAFTLEWYLRRQQAARTRAAEVIALADKYPFSHYETTAIIYRGWLLAERGESEAGIVLLQQGLAIRQQKGIVMFSPEFLTYLIEAYARVNHSEQGLAVVADTLALAEATGERYWNAELHRLKGELLLAQGATQGEVEGCFLQAVEIARQQNTKSLELRATMSLARLWQRQGRRAEAQPLVAAIYGWFTEGFDTPDLQAAQALLADLNQAA